MKKNIGSQRGFTLIEIMVVLAVIGIMAAVVVPNVTGFVGRGKSSTWTADQKALQTAVDGYWSDSKHQATYPLIASTNTISITALVTDGYLKGTDALPSANTSTLTGATNSQSGSYTWGIITSTGVVSSTPAFNSASPVYP
ncbi:MAG: prepilin-type N-terminal cleavage/methylation domain-containing protein [Dehalococcoidia bacterium]|nr:prepilin-type N-terminal cleavage/methylation domain-containing protein [Dehalococcoidia bacterium]